MTPPRARAPPPLLPQPPLPMSLLPRPLLLPLRSFDSTTSLRGGKLPGPLGLSGASWKHECSSSGGSGSGGYGANSALNNALVELCGNAYGTMGFPSDMALDLEPGSFPTATNCRRISPIRYPPPNGAQSGTSAQGQGNSA